MTPATRRELERLRRWVRARGVVVGRGVASSDYYTGKATELLLIERELTRRINAAKKGAKK